MDQDINDGKFVYSQLRDELEKSEFDVAPGLAVPPAKSKLTSPLSKFSIWSTRVRMGTSPARDQMDLRPLVSDEEVAEPAPTCPATSAYPALETGTGPRPVLSLLTVWILVWRERTRRLLLAALAGCLVVVAIALILALLCSRAPAHGVKSTESPTELTNGAELRVAAGADRALVLNELCAQHCARTRGEFGCVLGAYLSIGTFVSRPLDAELSAASCRCLGAELLCDRKVHCRNGSDERPNTCAHWNASKTCRSADFTCATGLASRPQPGRHRFCISKTARCDGHVDCDDQSDEQNCPLPPTLTRPANNAAARSDMLQKRRPRNEHVTQAPSTRIVAANESCERHCARTRGEFGCVLGGTPAIGAFVSEPTDSQLSSAGCRCLNTELLCDRNAHCRNGSDEWPGTCANWNASMTCRSSDFTCATGLAVQPQLGRRPFCIPKKARCDAHADCEDWSDEVNCPHLPPPPPLRLVRYVEATRHRDRSRDVAAVYSTQERRVFPISFTVTFSSLYVPGELCEGHCARKRGEFGCVLDTYQAIGAFVSQPTDGELRAEGCRCLNAELLCDRKAHCRDRSDEDLHHCIQWNATRSCRSSDFTCASGRASFPTHGRRPFCISKVAQCDGQFDCDDRSDELNCPILSAPSASAKSIRSPLM